MTAIQFVTKLQELAPSKEELVNSGVTEAGADRMIKNYIGIESSNVSLIGSNELVDLINNFNLSTVEVRLITFNGKVTEDSSYYFVGKVEVDHLVVNKVTNAVEVLDFDDLQNKLWSCAANASQFLDALILCASFSKQCMFDDDLWENSDIILKTALEISEVAGGEEVYEEFYKMLLGYF